MEVKKVNKKEIKEFTSLNKNSAQFEKAVKNLWNNGLSFPNWCFTIAQEGKIVGRVGYWAPADNHKEVRIFGLSLPWQSDNLFQIGQELLKESFKTMQDYGVEYIDSQLDSSEEDIFVLSQKLYKHVGLNQIQAKKRYKLDISEYDYTGNNRLNYRPLKEMEEDYFIDIIKEVTKGTFDKEDKLNIEKDGEYEAAKKHYCSLKSIDYSPDNWFIAYHNKELVGLVIPQHLNGDLGTINYIGVIPAKRGNGYVTDLLDKGIKNLIKRDINEIIADIDIENYPMEEALLKMGFTKERELLNYRKELN